MKRHIPQFMKNISKNLLFLTLFVIQGCVSQNEAIPLSEIKPINMELESGEKLQVTLALTSAQQTMGLSGKKSHEFQDNEGMLFFNLEDALRQFWMPDTYFDLDIFCLDKDLKVKDVDRSVPHYIGRDNPQDIPRAKSFVCRHVFEMKASSALSKKLKVGSQLIWKSPYSPEQIELSIRQAQ